MGNCQAGYCQDWWSFFGADVSIKGNKEKEKNSFFLPNNQ